jgi:biotin synthase
LQPQMVVVGPFIPHHETPFAGHPAGGTEKTLVCLAIVRLLLPRVLLPATTALGTIDGDGRVKGMDAGCNVIMPNLSPRDYREKYLLYDNKIATGLEAAESLEALRRSMAAAGYEIVQGRGDYLE